MYILSAYYLVWDALICRLLSLINNDWNVIKIATDLCGDETIGVTIGSLVYVVFGIIYYVAFLMFVWGIPAKKSYKWLITLIFFTPMIADVVCAINEIWDYRDLITQTFNIACKGLMLYLVLKAYKQK